MDRIQPPPSYYGGPYPQQGGEMSHPNYAPPPNMQGNSMNYTSPRKENDEDVPIGFNPVESNDYLTKFMKGHLSQKVKIYCAFTDSAQWHDQVFEGIVYAAGDDNIIIYNRSDKKYYLIMAVYILFIEFEDSLEPSKK